MALTPIDVQQKTFGTALRGYDLDEVDDFLDEVVTSLQGYEQRLVEAQARIQALETELADKGDSESAISRALVAAWSTEKVSGTGRLTSHSSSMLLLPPV